MPPSIHPAPQNANFRFERQFSTPSKNWRSAVWNGGAFDVGKRDPFDETFGELSLSSLTVFVTLSGGTKHTECADESGLRYLGKDFSGAVSIVPANMVRTVRMSKGAYEWASLSLSDSILRQSIGEDHALNQIGAVYNERDPLLSELISLLSRHERQFGLDPLLADSISTTVSHHLHRSYARAPLPVSQRETRIPPYILRRVTDYIQENLSCRIDTQALADIAGLSPSHFSRSFKRSLGVAPYCYVTRERMLRAKQRLAETNQSIISIALDCGFNSPSQFSAVFRKETGCSPTEYRRHINGN